MAAGAAAPGLFFCFAAMVLLIFVRIKITLIIPLSLTLEKGVGICTEMERHLPPEGGGK